MAYQQIEGGLGGASASTPFGVSSIPSTGGGGGGGGDQTRVNRFETSLPVRVDIGAALTYLLLGLTGVIFLILEQKNDFIRFHAWQSVLVCCPLLLLHIAFVWQNVISFILLAVDIIVIAFLMYKAYTAGRSTLDRFQVPLLGKYASQWVDSE